MSNEPSNEIKISPEAEDQEAGPVSNGNGGHAGKGRGERERSETAYPYYGLAKVMQIVAAVREVGANEAAPAADVMRRLKINKNDRMWAYGIPAAIMFGVIERVGRGDDAKIKLTEMGRRLALPGPGDEHRVTKNAVVRTPEIYTKLLERYAGHPVPSKDALRNILHRDYGIVESMAGNAADAFLESVTIAEIVSQAGTLPSDASSREAPTDSPTAIVTSASDEVPPGMQMLLLPREFIVYNCKIGKGNVIKIPLPPEFTRAELKRLYAFLKTQVDDMDDGDDDEKEGPA